MYKGGKNGNGTYQTIINQIPEHDIYSEFFTGSAAIYRKLKPADIAFLFEKSQQQLSFIKKILAPGHIAHSFDTVANINFLVDVFNLFHSCGYRIFVYADPPYPFSSRTYQKPIYKHEMSDSDHIAFLTGIRRAKFSIAISTYKNSIYSEKLSDWRLLQYQSIVRGGTRTEYLYMNYPETSHLHDFSFIGKNFREREKFERIKNNTVRKLQTIDKKLLNSILNSL